MVATDVYVDGEEIEIVVETTVEAAGVLGGHEDGAVGANLMNDNGSFVAFATVDDANAVVLSVVLVVAVVVNAALVAGTAIQVLIEKLAEKAAAQVVVDMIAA